MNNQDQIFKLIKEEKNRQLGGLELIASENFTSDNVMKATGSILTNKYAEGYPGKRYYGGCEVVDKIENFAIDRLKALFNVEYANVQPHSGSQANTAVFDAFLNPGDKILGLDLAHGGHLTHGSNVNFSGKIYNSSFYGVNNDGVFDYEKILERAKEVKPNLIIVGASAYSRDINFSKFREIADEVGAFLHADIAHPSGLIAKGFLSDPVPHCHVITSTTHKTLRGPRGGIMMMGKDFDKHAKKENRKIDCLIQLKISKEESKFGLQIEDFKNFYESLKNYKNLNVIGLMGMASFTNNNELIDKEFKKIKTIYDKMVLIDGRFKVLSIGMSDDYDIALENGANMIRVGSKIFGKRNY